MSLEQPDYTVVFKDGAIEYRQYAPYLVAETVIENVEDYKAAGNEGFRRLFRYITGNNRGSSEISMTAPVQQTPPSEKIAMTVPVQRSSSEGGWRVAFMLPTKYTLETAPEPADTRVKIRAVPGRLMAVLRYSGRWTTSNYEEKKLELFGAMDAEGVEPVGEMQSAQYDAPYIPPFMRRNEVMVEVTAMPATTQAVSLGQVPAGQGSY